MSDFPYIGKPQRQEDGTYIVKVERGPDDSRDMPYPGKAEAERGIQALRLAQDLLVAVPKPPSKAGRPTKLTREVQELICSKIAEGADQKDAWVAADISKGAYYQWIKKGKAARSGKYRRFVDALTRARDAWKVARLARIQEHGRRDWRADAWRLECAHPDEFGRKRRMELTGADGGPVAISGDNALAKLCKLLGSDESEDNDGSMD